MTSQLNVDTIKGQTAETSISIQGEGSATVNLQQGVVKAWTTLQPDASSNYVYDSFNNSGPTDNGTGDWTYAFTNNMSNNDYSFVSIHGSAGSNSAFSRSNTYATGSIRFWTYTGAGTTDATLITTTVHGDLA